MALKIDELNNLRTTKTKKRRAIPYRQYFEEMGLDDEQVEKRVEHSEKLSPILFFIITYILMLLDSDYDDDLSSAKAELEELYLEMIKDEEVAIDDELRQYVKDFAEEFVETTKDRVKESESKEEIPESDLFYISDDRADLVAENEANTVYNYDDFREAVAKGAVYKMWITEKDDKVRATHAEVDNTAIPVLEYFNVGDSLMRFPKDTSMGASLTEICNCRCRIEYVKSGAE